MRRCRRCDPLFGIESRIAEIVDQFQKATTQEKVRLTAEYVLLKEELASQHWLD